MAVVAKDTPPPNLHPVDLLKAGPVKRILRNRAFPFVAVLVNLFFFAVVILTGLLGTPVGNANFSIIFVWIVWWALLIMLLIPFGGRAWCTICPIPAVGEWTQRRGSIISRSKSRPFTLGKAWPRVLRNIWLQNFAFLGVACFSAVILTRPVVTGALLLGFMVAALGFALVFQRRAFCRYVCPVSGFIGLYATAAPLELRVVDSDACLQHCGIRGKECVKGSEAGYGCPWMEYPGTLNRNSYCGLCLECVKTCPQDNLALRLRSFGKDLLVPKRHLDEAYKGFIMLAAAVLYSTVMSGPWGWLKDWANLGSGSPLHFAGYVGLLFGLTLIVLPGLFLAVSWAARTLSRTRTISLKTLFTSYAYVTVPLGLAAWIAFSVGFVFINISYVFPVISDPFGWGWNLFHTANYHWTPYVSQVVPYLQASALLAGLAMSIVFGDRLARENYGDTVAAKRSMLPVMVFSTAVTLGLLWIYLG